MPTNPHLRKVASHHDAEAPGYDEHYSSEFPLYHRLTMDSILRFLPSATDVPILDAGGGTGIFTVELARLGYRVVLVDVSPGMLSVARDKVARLGLTDRVEIREGDICRMPEFADESFSMVLCEGDPLSYCGDHKAAMRELARVVRPGGAVIVSVDNRSSAVRWLREPGDRAAVERLLSIGELMMPGKDGRPLYPIHAFTADELRELLTSNGLAVERIIGKPVLAGRLSGLDAGDIGIQDFLYRLELVYNSDPAHIPWAGHLEAVGRKPR